MESKKNNPPIEIREVWAENLEEEFALITDLVDRFPYVAMDTEFPGVVFKPSTTYETYSDFLYQTLKVNVDALNLIQVGLTFADSTGNLPDLGTDSQFIWQFNFKDFDLSKHLYSPASISLLEKHGIDFKKNLTAGIDSKQFTDLLMRSGVMCNHRVTWVTFHSAYDFGYLLKLLTCAEMPGELELFLAMVKAYFGEIYDLKYMMKYCGGLYGGLARLAEALNVDRAVGSCHQAGSDSLLTWHAFVALRDRFFGGVTEPYAGVLYGLENY
ncbi:probable CCR4-associated factor 1 homolog 9 [Amborella trichopoda]|uniref:poly(A)-specific ribonuclease n=1 Tax=Amborella trichopoda TaxID=13333 RepID=U5D445_AMBTC|nr:probable CCR4-associated factor 1 homolog 9 [Amborella trichopoda]ERN16187.1 hypothetical protein AMTR_s00030p00236940 [Amborella trichopoda]|eukprot:XP_020529405.1 probable CCR4-associated factor 1 homolog 9 [Amborella trichopoda]